MILIDLILEKDLLIKESKVFYFKLYSKELVSTIRNNISANQLV
jgi:hypothetical protein